MKKIRHGAWALALTCAIGATWNANAFSLTGKKTDKPLSETQAPGPLACDRGSLRKDGKPCLPTCDANGTNPFTGDQNCLAPNKLSQIGTKVKDGLHNASQLYQYNQQQVADNMEYQKEMQSQGDKVNRNSDHLDTGGSAYDLGIL